MHITGINVRMMLCVLLTVTSLHLSDALFGDDAYWKASNRINCAMESLLSNNKCDGKIHCTDMSDEENCNMCRGKNVFHCNNNRCISEYLRCDGYDDCWDGSDEWNCNNWVPKFSGVIDVPVTIEHFDAKSYKMIESYDDSTMLDDIQLKLIAYKTTRSNDALDARTVIFNHMKKVVIYIPGFKTDDLKDGVDIKNALVTGADDVDCIVLVDWRKGSYYDHGWKIRTYPWEKPEDYINVVTYILPFVGKVLAEFIHEKIPEHVKVHLIGFSLGGHLAGLTGRTLKNNNLRTIDRITGIDPAGPLLEFSMKVFTVNTTNALRKTDAAFVDVIHACIILGMKKEIGHIDIFVDDIDCVYPYCLHRRAVEVFIASLITCSQITCPYDNFTLDLECDVPDPSHLSSLGYLTDKYTGRGKHRIAFYRNDEGQMTSTGNCSEYLKVELAAKHRICRSTIDCEAKPYLSECHIPCTGGMDVKSVCGIEDNNIDTSSSSLKFKNTGKIPMVSWSEVSNDQNCHKPLSCTVEKSVPVQYYVAYKKPNSLDYFYISRSERGNSITEQTGMYPFSNPESVLGQTLAPIYTSGNSITYMIWNEDIPYSSIAVMNDTRINGGIPTDATSFGHSKGVIAYRKSGGFLFSHSIPRFPSNPQTEQYEYPLSGHNMGQMAVCVTGQQYNKNIVNELEALLDLMINFKPRVYASNILHDDWSIGIRDKIQELIYPRVKKLGATVIDTNVYGQPFIKIHSFSKSDGKNFQDSFINLAEHYQTPIFAKSRTDKNSLIPSNCKNSFTVENIKAVHLITGSHVELWDHMKDLSKWIVSKTDEGRLVCMGDLNRERNNMVRGGMFVCIQDADFYEMYLKNVHFDFHSCQH